MSRVKRGVSALKSRKNLLSHVKGFRHGRKKKLRQATTAMYHSGVDAFAGRRDKKNDYRRLWTVRINAAVRPLGTSYSRFIADLKTANIALDRKVLSEIALQRPEVFAEIVKKVTSK